jgi:hypothetical protein
MPVRSLGRGCYQWGRGKIYCGRGARQKAERQGRAAYSHGYKENTMANKTASQKSWQGLNRNEAIVNSVHNALVAVILDGVKGVSPPHPGHEWRQISPEEADAIIARGKHALADLEGQAPAPGGARGRAQKWMGHAIDTLRRQVSDAEAVRAGKRPQKMKPEDYEALRKSLGVGETRPGTVAATDVNFQNGERIRIRVIGPKGQLADPPFWYTVTGTMSVEDVALQFTQTIQPGMFVSISDGKNSWTFQKETYAGKNSVRRTHKLPTARYRETREAGGHRVADFNTLDDLIAHARGEGATHVLHVDDEVHLYFLRRDGSYEKSEVWQKDGYWHTQGPGSRVVVRKPPENAQPIKGQRGAAEARGIVRDYEAVDSRDRLIAGPFKSYGDAKDAAGPAGAVRFVPKGKKATEAKRDRRRDQYVYADELRVGDVIYDNSGEATVVSVSDSDQHGYRNIEVDIDGGRKTFRYYGESTVPIKRRASTARTAEASRVREDGAEEAGAAYAQEQLESDHFMDWVREQLLEASKMPASDVLPLEDKHDAKIIARNMLQQLEWDTRREHHESAEFYKGFRSMLDSQRDWLADELLTMNQEIKGVDVGEKGKVRSGPKPVDDPEYIIQGLYSDGTTGGGFAEFGFDDEAVAVAEAKKIARSNWFEGDYVRVITRDGELVWSSQEGVGEKKRRRPKAKRSVRHRR